MQRRKPGKDAEIWGKWKKWGLFHEAADSNYSVSYDPYERMVALSLESSNLVPLNIRALEHATSIFQLSFLPCSGARQMCLVIVLYKTPQNIQIYQGATRTITTEEKKLALFWTNISSWWGTGIDKLLREAEKEQNILSQFYLSVCVFVWTDCITTHNEEKKTRGLWRCAPGSDIWQGAAWYFKSGEEQKLLGFVLSQHCSFGNLCSQAGSYTHSVQIHHLSSEVQTSEKRGSENKIHRHKGTQQCEETKPYTVLNIAIKPFLRCPQKWIGESIWVQLDASQHSFS